MQISIFVQYSKKPIAYLETNIKLNRFESLRRWKNHNRLNDSIASERIGQKRSERGIWRKNRRKHRLEERSEISRSTCDWSLWKERNILCGPRYALVDASVWFREAWSGEKVWRHKLCYDRPRAPLSINAGNRVRGKSLQVARTTFIVLDEEEATCASHGKWYLFRLFFFVRGASAGTGNVRRCWDATKTTGRNTFLHEEKKKKKKERKKGRKKNLRSIGKLDNRVACFFE